MSIFVKNLHFSTYTFPTTYTNTAITRKFRQSSNKLFHSGKKKHSGKTYGQTQVKTVYTEIRIRIILMNIFRVTTSSEQICLRGKKEKKIIESPVQKEPFSEELYAI